MSYIYEPKGKAREYSPLALNTYSGGCDHGCRYCYCSGIMRGAWGTEAKPRNMSAAILQREARQSAKQILLSFIADPYCSGEQTHRKTRAALNVLASERCSVAILSKGGSRCLDDLDIFKAWPESRIKVGATLTFNSAALSSEWEPGAATPADRVDTLRQLHNAGVETWASIEPVIVPSESLAIIEASLPYCNAYKVGRWNHDARSNSIDWAEFGKAAVDMIRAAGKRLYVKHDLRPHLPDGYLTSQESDMNSLSLPDRPKERTLFA